MSVLDVHEMTQIGDVPVHAVGAFHVNQHTSILVAHLVQRCIESPPIVMRKRAPFGTP